MRKLFLMVLLIFPLLISAKDSKDLIKKIRDNYENLQSCESEMIYQIFRGFNSEIAVEEYDGYFCRMGENSYRKIQQIEYLNAPSENLFLQIDHRDQSMYVSAPIVEELFNADLEKSLSMCGNILTSKIGDQTIFSLMLNKTHSLPYARIDLQVDPNFWITKVTLFYASKLNFSKDFNRPEMDDVKMSITYKNFKKEWVDANARLSIENYLKGTESDLVPIDLYKNYSIVDLRKK